MYLDLLNDKEKELFLSFAYNLSAVDKDYSPEERVTMAAYCREMGVAFDMDKINLSVEKTINEINEVCDEQIKKIIVFEAIKLAMSDTDYDDDERKIIDDAVEKFDIDASYHDEVEKLLNELASFNTKINKLVIGEEEY